MSSRRFGSKSPSVPHLAKGEIGDLRKDVDEAFALLEAEADSVALVSDLSSLDDSSMRDGCVKYCLQVRDFFVLDKTSSSTIAEAVTVATRSGTGRWERICVQGTLWAKQASWKVDPSAGSDVAVGSPAAPLKTWAEFRRRVTRLAVSMNVLIGGNLTEVINGSFGAVPGVVDPVLTIEGVPTVLVAGSTASTFVAPNPATNAKATTANGAGWTKWFNGGKKFVHYGTLSAITN